MSKTADLKIGQMVGAWEIIANPKKLGMENRYLCHCICGVERWVSAFTLRNGSSKSCGCQRSTRRFGSNPHDNFPSAQKVLNQLNLIQLGYLPPADQLSIEDGSPSWTLESIAIILGVDFDNMLGRLENSPPEFKGQEPKTLSGYPRIVP